MLLDAVDQQTLRLSEVVQSHLATKDEEIKIGSKSLGNPVPSSSAKRISNFHHRSTKADRSLRGRYHFETGDMGITLSTGLTDIGPVR